MLLRIMLVIIVGVILEQREVSYVIKNNVQ